MKKIKAASLIAASVIAVSSFGTLTAGAVTFTENKTTGAKTWTFTVTDSDYPEGVTTDDSNGDMIFDNSDTYYVSDKYSTTTPDGDYLTLQVNNTGTREGVQYSSLYLNQNRNETSSTLSWTVPEDGTITLTTYNELNLYINDSSSSLEWAEGGTQKTYSVKEGDSIKIDAPRHGSIHELKFTPVQNYTAMYSFRETADNLNGKTLMITTTDGDTKKTQIDTSGTHFSGDGNVSLGVIINNIPRNVTINSVTIQ